MLHKTTRTRFAGIARATTAHRISVFGFWVYLMTDCIIFASLFAVFAVMGHQFAGGPTGKDLFEIPGVMLETADPAAEQHHVRLRHAGRAQGQVGRAAGVARRDVPAGRWRLSCWKCTSSRMLIAQGYGPDRSAFLSAFFTLVGTHGLHVTVGLIWMVVLAVQVIGNKKVTQRDLTRLTCLSLFWHFLDIVWICVFTFVYLTSVV